VAQNSLRGDYAAMLRRRKWVALLSLVIVPVTAVVLAVYEQQARYQATAQVLITTESAATRLIAGQGGTEDPARLAQTQASLARANAIARGTLDRVGLRGRNPDDFLAASTVTADPSADLLNFRVTDPSRPLAIRLATAYAEEFALYRSRLESKEADQLRRRTEARLAALRASGETGSPLYATLAGRVRDLGILEAVQTPDYLVANRPEGAVQVSPRPVRTGLLGLILGCVLALGLMLLAEARDKTVHSAEEIRHALRVPLLARLRSPSRKERAEPLVMLTHPNGEAAERFRTLRTNLRFANIEVGAKTILFTSAVKAEGKSTTAANVAVALARAGTRVVLVDLDVRRPRLQQLFELDDRVGLIQVVLEQARLEDAVQPVRMTRAALKPVEAWSTTGGSPSNGPQGFGELHLLGCGPTTTDVGEFFTHPRLATLLQTLRSVYDLVLIDAAPLLGVSDAAILSAHVDALVVVTRVRKLRHDALEDIVTALDASPATTLGFVVTAAELDENERTDYYRGYYGSFTPSEQDRDAERRGAR
jgi:polysaccharide biosynthesis transport protein